MANTQGPWGFRPVRRLDGAAPNYQYNPYQLAYNNANTIAKGDPVKLLASGFIDVLAPGVIAPFGIFWGCSYIDPNFQRTVWLNAWKAPSLASTVIVTAWVYDDPNLVFEAQSGNSASSGYAQGNVGNNTNFGGQSTPNAGGLSQAYADQATINTTATLPFRIIGLGQKIGNDNTSPYNTVEVVMNAPQIRAALGV
jgi:hypothetical protein